MTTQPQRSQQALAREGAGLLVLSLGLLGALIALGAIHWALSAVTAMAGLIVAGVLIRSSPKPWLRTLGAVSAVAGYWGMAVCAYVLYAPLGLLVASLIAVAAGLVLISEGD